MKMFKRKAFINMGNMDFDGMVISKLLLSVGWFDYGGILLGVDERDLHSSEVAAYNKKRDADSFRGYFLA